MSNRNNYSPQRGNRRSGYNSGRSRGGRSRRNNFFLPKGTNVYILDRLKHGGIDREKHGWNPICQVVLEKSFELFEIEYQKGADFKLQEKLQIIGKEGILGKVSRRLKYSDLTPTASEMLEPVLIKIIEDNEVKYIDWINKAGPITIRRHYLELLPGVGKKLMNKILEEREKNPFESIKDLHVRVHGFSPTKAIAQRILRELEEQEVKHHVFIRKTTKNFDNQDRDNRGSRSHNQNKKYPTRNQGYSKRRYY